MFYLKRIFKIFILFLGLPYQSSFVQGDFKCSFESMQSSFENHNSSAYFEVNLESIHVHNIFEANFVIFW